ncbi:hypothetical protein [uncultured Thiodictyon sp.]|uniref:hypothetical protein n=1 Tax=uncultured Thiodictyon sp. TaxID=1846217 RepID=UPI0025D7A78C|nr:hypothetical protein [uncultured Thiodictyon sp.]
MTIQTKLHRALDRMQARWINLLLLAVGLLAIAVGALFDMGTDGKSIWLSVGCSLFASAVVSGLTARYLVRSESIREVVRDWGLVAIFRTRQDMNRSADDALMMTDSHIDIIAWGLKSFRDSQDHVVREKVRKGLRLRILAPDPDSPFVAQRERDENEVAGQIKNTIIQLQAWVAELQRLAKDPGAVQLRHYVCLPQDFYFRADGHLFIGPYLYGIASQQTVSYEFCSPSRGFSHYTQYFERLWDDPQFGRAQPGLTTPPARG